ncbi:MAG: type II toxin-antitoxin system VapC family toxin [Actinomycetota bacterium]
MAGYLIDTNVISEIRKGARADGGVRRWFDEHLDDDMWLSVLVVGELRRGVESISRRDPTAGAAIEGWLDGIVSEFADRVLPITLPMAERWGRLSVPDPLPVVDGLLAATAIEHELVLVTRNTADVERTGVETVNPFDDL